MVRLFTAIELQPEVRAAIASRQSELARLAGHQGDGLRLVRSAQLHLTLVFIGEVTDERVPAIVEAMARDLTMPPFDLEFAGCGIFPPRGPARVLWLGVSRGASNVVSLFDLVSERLSAVGVPRETRPFTPHLTLGRWRGTGGRPRLPDIGAVAAQHVSAVTLFQSRLLPAGPEHTVLAQAPLSAGADPVN